MSGGEANAGADQLVSVRSLDRMVPIGSIMARGSSAVKRSGSSGRSTLTQPVRSTAVRGTFNDADLVNGRIVFNISHNRYRLIAWPAYRTHKLFVKAVLTHKEYDEGKWK